MDEKLREILFVYKFKHCHVAGKGGNPDPCDKCGENIRHPVHQRVSEDTSESGLRDKTISQIKALVPEVTGEMLKTLKPDPPYWILEDGRFNFEGLANAINKFIKGKE
jgi:hypothetical protein